MNKQERKECYKKRRLAHFGFVPLNKPFEGAVGHHINKQQVIYMPDNVHRSIWHSVLKNINMDAINTVAFNWLYEERK